MNIEAKPDSTGWYWVILHQYNKEKESYPDKIKDCLVFDGERWDYGDYAGSCYVCEIIRKDDDEVK